WPAYWASRRGARIPGEPCHEASNLPSGCTVADRLAVARVRASRLRAIATLDPRRGSRWRFRAALLPGPRPATAHRKQAISQGRDATPARRAIRRGGHVAGALGPFGPWRCGSPGDPGAGTHADLPGRR